jgi:hypothetical protein
MIGDFFLALSLDMPFKTAYKRLRHIKHGHPFDKSTFIEKQRFENHPQNDKSFVYTANLMHCDECGLEYLDEGFESTYRL